jgi:predicted ABC-type sugar transport system permease subunit
LKGRRSAKSRRIQNLLGMLLAVQLVMQLAVQLAVHLAVELAVQLVQSESIVIVRCFPFQLLLGQGKRSEVDFLIVHPALVVVSFHHHHSAQDRYGDTVQEQ